MSTDSSFSLDNQPEEQYYIQDKLGHFQGSRPRDTQSEGNSTKPESDASKSSGSGLDQGLPPFPNSGDGKGGIPDDRVDIQDIQGKILKRIFEHDLGLFEKFMKLQLSAAKRTTFASQRKEDPMLNEPFAISILMKAVDFLFGEAKTILEERRTARQNSKQQTTPAPDIPLIRQDKESLIKQLVAKELVKYNEQAIRSILDEIETYRYNLEHCRRRVALEGGLPYASLSAINELRVQEDCILEASQRLASILDSLTK
jgi:hypothetical protein